MIALRKLFSSELKESSKIKIAFAKTSYKSGENPLELYLDDSNEAEGLLAEYIGHIIGAPLDGKRTRRTTGFQKGDTVLQFVKLYDNPKTYEYLFIGAFIVGDEVDSIHEKGGTHYEMHLRDDLLEEFIGRLVVEYHIPRGKVINRDKYDDVIDAVEVSRILKSPYSGVRFEGLNNIRLNYRQLHNIIKSQSAEWKEKLNAMPGVYLITDLHAGKLYVGSAYSKEGIWNRWSNYAESLTGGNSDFEKLVSEYGEDYIKNNFQYTLLELLPSNTPRDKVIEREHYWMSVLDSRTHGYNNN